MPLYPESTVKRTLQMEDVLTVLKQIDKILDIHKKVIDCISHPPVIVTSSPVDPMKDQMKML